MNKHLFGALACLGLLFAGCQKETPEQQSAPRDETFVSSAARQSKSFLEQSVRILYIIPSDREFNRDYYNAITKTARTIQRWYKENLDGYSYRLNNPIVQVVESAQPAAWFNTDNGTSGSDPLFYFFWNAYNEAQNLLGDGFDFNRYTFHVYVDAPGATGAGFTGFATLPENDLKGLAGLIEGSWVGGNAHELGHAFGLPHPPDGDPSWNDALMGFGYIQFPNSELRESDETTLLNSGFFFDKKGIRVPKKQAPAAAKQPQALSMAALP